MHFKKDRKWIIEELLKENEIDQLIHAAATVITETTTRPGKIVKNVRNKDSW